MRPALFDVLEGRFGGEVPLEAVPDAERTLHSVIGNLRRLFNSRQGAVAHLPSYGLPDLTEVYGDGSRAVEALRRAVQAAVEAYEPRLKRVRVEPVPVSSGEMRIALIVSGELEPGRRVRLETAFRSHAPAEVRPATA